MGRRETTRGRVLAPEVVRSGLVAAPTQPRGARAWSPPSVGLTLVA